MSEMVGFVVGGCWGGVGDVTDCVTERWGVQNWIIKDDVELGGRL